MQKGMKRSREQWEFEMFAFNTEKQSIIARKYRLISYFRVRIVSLDETRENP